MRHIPVPICQFTEQNVLSDDLTCMVQGNTNLKTY